MSRFIFKVKRLRTDLRSVTAIEVRRGQLFKAVVDGTSDWQTIADEVGRLAEEEDYLSKLYANNPKTLKELEALWRNASNERRVKLLQDHFDLLRIPGHSRLVKPEIVAKLRWRDLTEEIKDDLLA